MGRVPVEGRKWAASGRWGALGCLPPQMEYAHRSQPHLGQMGCILYNILPDKPSPCPPSSKPPPATHNPFPSPPPPHLSLREMRMSVMQGGSSGSTQPSTLVQGCSTTRLAAHGASSPGPEGVKWNTDELSAAPTKPCGAVGSCRKRTWAGREEEGVTFVVD